MFITNMRRNGGRPPTKVCPHCHIPHNGECHARLIADGKVPPKWESKSADQKQRIAKRTESIVPGCCTTGRYNRPQGPRGVHLRIASGR